MIRELKTQRELAEILAWILDNTGNGEFADHRLSAYNGVNVAALVQFGGGGTIKWIDLHKIGWQRAFYRAANE